MATLLHAVAGYVFLTVMVRVLRRRPGAQMTMAEFVLVFLMGGVIILATVGRDRSMTNCTCAVIAVALMHRGVSLLKIKYPAFGRLLDGSPLIAVRNGEWQDHVLSRANFERDDVMAAARLQGIGHFEEIQYAVLERNGGFSVIEREENGESQGDGDGG